MSTTLSQVALIAGASSYIVTAVLARHSFANNTLPRRRFVQNAVLDDELELFEAGVLAHVRGRMDNRIDMKTTALFDKINII